MNTIVARMLGEADHHSPEEQADLAKYAPHDETGGGAEETKEVQLAKQILAAAQNQDFNQVIKAASELIRMHHPQAQVSYERETTRPKSLALSMMAAPVSQSYPSSP